MTLATGCVHEFPHEGDRRDVVLHVSHATDWTYHDMTITRGDVPAPAPQSPQSGARYHIQVFPQGSQEILLHETEIFSFDLSRQDFTTKIQLPPGSYDLWIWSDYADSNTQSSHFFDSSDFSGIVYAEPYNGNNELRDAFRGMVSFTVDSNIDDDYFKEVWIELERPLARYEFISTDLEEFIASETTRNQMTGKDDETGPNSSPATRFPLEQYHVKMKYTGYMPSKFNNFIDKPVDSRTGMEYDADITKLTDNEARLGFDYVMVNGRESSVKVAMEVYDPKGELIGRTNSIDVVTKRSMNTTVRGKFLTSNVAGGVGIDPSFNGSFNVPVN